MDYRKNSLLFGTTVHPQMRIKINNSIKSEHKKETLLHEVIHILSSETGIKLRENQVGALSSGLYDTMKRNRYRIW